MTYSVKEIFYTLQGEGGQAAGGCGGDQGAVGFTELVLRQPVVQRVPVRRF